MRFVIVLAALAAAACDSAPPAGVPEYTYEVGHAYPHDRSAFTEGLFYLDGYLYEGTGLGGQSDIRKVKPETGEIVQRHALGEEYFGEGIINWHDKLYQLTYKNQIGFIYDLKTLHPTGKFAYTGQGWAFTAVGKQIYMDGSRAVNAEASDPEIRVWDPESLEEKSVIRVTDQDRPVQNLNELEWVKGEIFANIWQT